MDQNSRAQVLFDFKKQIIRILVATDVAGLLPDV
jgi:superfamily II DNA/RNA helicase